LERVRTQQVGEGGGDLRLLGHFFLLFVEALSFVQPVGGVLRCDARGRDRASHLSGDRGVEFVGWGVQVRQWQLAFPDLRPVNLNINLSTKQLLHPNLVEEVATILRETELNPRSMRP